MRPRPVRSLRGRGHLSRNEPSPVGTTYQGQPFSGGSTFPPRGKAGVSYALRTNWSIRELTRPKGAAAPRSSDSSTAGPRFKSECRLQNSRVELGPKDPSVGLRRSEDRLLGPRRFSLLDVLGYLVPKGNLIAPAGEHAAWNKDNPSRRFGAQLDAESSHGCALDSPPRERS